MLTGGLKLPPKVKNLKTWPFCKGLSLKPPKEKALQGLRLLWPQISAPSAQNNKIIS